MDTFRLIINFSDFHTISSVVLENKKNHIFINKYDIRSRIQHRNSRKLDYKPFKKLHVQEGITRDWASNSQYLNLHNTQDIQSYCTEEHEKMGTSWELGKDASISEDAVFQKKKNLEIRIQR